MTNPPLSEKLQQKAIIEVNENPNRIPEYLNHLREWAHKQPHLHIRTDDQWLLAFLRGSKYSLQKAKEKLDLYYTKRTSSPEIFANRNPFLPEIQDLFKVNCGVVLPNQLDELAPVRIFIQPKRSDPEKVLLKTVLKTVFMLADIHLYDDAEVINGQEIILDMEGLPYGYLLQATPTYIQTTITLIESAYPSRLKGIYFVNTPQFVNSVIKLGMQLVPEKIRNRVHFYTKNNIQDLYNIIPLTVFPTEFGGKAGPISALSDKLRLKLESCHDWFQEDSKYYSDESQRPGKPITASDFFNIEGSFKKLDID